MPPGPRGRRILAIGAFPFPYPQGSQVFAGEQAQALARAGAQVAFACYGASVGRAPEGVALVRSSQRIAPRTGRSGPSLAKLAADPALVATVVRAQRARRFDLALAHNAEAALVAMAARACTGLRFVYVAHTLLERELSAYAPSSLAPAADAAGRALDRLVAGAADGVVALARQSERVLARAARGPLARIPPGLAPSAPPSEAAQRAACARHGLAPRGFFLYAGNLDGYQELALLDASARELGRDAPPVVVATHDASGADRFPNLRVVELDDFAQVRELAFAATALVLARRRAGGFPIKLLNYMEAARPIVAFADVADGLVDGETALLLGSRDGPRELAAALRAAAADPARARSLGSAAHEHLRAAHDWPALAARTLDLVDRALDTRPTARGSAPVGAHTRGAAGGDPTRDA
ncbi:MAG: glycosyltransferase [Myxococcota bacterium]